MNNSENTPQENKQSEKDTMIAAKERICNVMSYLFVEIEKMLNSNKLKGEELQLARHFENDAHRLLAKAHYLTNDGTYLKAALLFASVRDLNKSVAKLSIRFDEM